jgi:hypothetical protein
MMSHRPTALASNHSAKQTLPIKKPRETDLESFFIRQSPRRESLFFLRTRLVFWLWKIEWRLTAASWNPCSISKLKMNVG